MSDTPATRLAIYVRNLECLRTKDPGGDRIYFEIKVGLLNAKLLPLMRFPIRDVVAMQTGGKWSSEEPVFTSDSLRIPFAELAFVEVEMDEEDIPVVGGGILRNLPETLRNVMDHHLGGFTLGMAEDNSLDWKLEKNTAELGDKNNFSRKLLRLHSPEQGYDYSLTVEAVWEKM
jgi:hypothetical protein